MPQNSIAEQFGPVARRSVSRVPRQLPIVQVMATLAGGEVEEASAEARRQVLKWLSKRSGRLPNDAWEFRDFELSAPGTPSSGVRLKQGALDYWAVRLDYMDDEVAGRTWTTEATIAFSQETVRPVFGLRLTVATRETEPQFEPSIPGVVRQLVESPGLEFMGQKVSESPWVVDDGCSVDELIGLIQEPQRRRPIYVISIPEGLSDLSGVAVDPYELAIRCLCIAHVVVLTSEASYMLTDRVGKEFSVFGGAVRTYLPNCDLSSDSPYDHFLALPERIDQWSGGGQSAFARNLVRRAARESLQRIRGEDELPAFATVKQTALRLKREEAKAIGEDDADLFAIAETEIMGLKRDVEDSLSLAEGEQDRRIEAEQELTAIRSHNHWLRSRVDHLEKTFAEIAGHPIDGEILIPDGLGDLRHWSEEYLPGLVYITGRAARAAKGSEFQDVTLAYQSILLLAREYRDMRLGRGKGSFVDKCADLGLECSATHSGARAGEEGDEYYVTYLGRRRYLDTHLKKGNSREPRYCLRVYFFWDEDNQLVVVGSMPGHLTTRIS